MIYTVPSFVKLTTNHQSVAKFSCSEYYPSLRRNAENKRKISVTLLLKEWLFTAPIFTKFTVTRLHCRRYSVSNFTQIS